MKTKELLILVCSIFCFCSCKKEKIVTVIKEVPLVHSWSLDSTLISFNRILLTSVVIDDTTLGVANNSLIYYVHPNLVNKHVDGAYINFSPNYGYLVKPNITKTISVTLVDSSQLRVFSTLSPVSNYGAFTFTPTYTNAKYSIKGFPLPNYPGAGYPIINSKYILAPTEIDYEAKKSYLSLLKVDYDYDPLFEKSVRLASSKTITLTPGPGTINFAEGNYFSAAYYNKFFLSHNDEFYRVDTLGNVKAFGYCPVPTESNGRVTQMFTLNNNLFAIGNFKFFVSQDEGETWSLFSDVTSTQYGFLDYYNVGAELYAAYGAQLFKVTLTGNTLNYQELDNDGLATSQITSINKVGNYAFVTTLSGLYYRDTAGFNTPKK